MAETLEKIVNAGRGLKKSLIEVKNDLIHKPISPGQLYILGATHVITNVALSIYDALAHGGSILTSDGFYNTYNLLSATAVGGWTAFRGYKLLSRSLKKPAVINASYTVKNQKNLNQLLAYLTTNQKVPSFPEIVKTYEHISKQFKAEKNYLNKRAAEVLDKVHEIQEWEQTEQPRKKEWEEKQARKEAKKKETTSALYKMLYGLDDWLKTSLIHQQDSSVQRDEMNKAYPQRALPSLLELDYSDYRIAMLMFRDKDYVKWIDSRMQKQLTGITPFQPFPDNTKLNVCKKELEKIKPKLRKDLMQLASEIYSTKDSTPEETKQSLYTKITQDLRNLAQYMHRPQKTGAGYYCDKAFKDKGLKKRAAEVLDVVHENEFELNDRDYNTAMLMFADKDYMEDVKFGLLGNLTAFKRGDFVACEQLLAGYSKIMDWVKPKLQEDLEKLASEVYSKNRVALPDPGEAPRPSVFHDYPAKLA